MKIIALAVTAVLAAGLYAVPATAQDRHDNGDPHEMNRDRHDMNRDRHDMHGDRHDWGRHHGWHRHCMWTWRHHHHVRVCR